ncbi:hypothetical protein JMJ77_0000957, partial [Colletotrichum scovillei]
MFGTGVVQEVQLEFGACTASFSGLLSSGIRGALQVRIGIYSW